MSKHLRGEADVGVHFRVRFLWPPARARKRASGRAYDLAAHCDLGAVELSFRPSGASSRSTQTRLVTRFFTGIAFPHRDHVAFRATRGPNHHDQTPAEQSVCLEPELALGEGAFREANDNSSDVLPASKARDKDLR